MRRTPLAAMLTLLAAVLASLALAACGGKETPSGSKATTPSTSTSTTPGVHKKPSSKTPGY